LTVKCARLGPTCIVLYNRYLYSASHGVSQTEALSLHYFSVPGKRQGLRRETDRQTEREGRKEGRKEWGAERINERKRRREAIPE